MADKKKKNLLATYGSDVDGITGSGPLEDDDQGGLAVSANTAPDAGTTAPIDTGGLPEPDTQSPMPSRPQVPVNPQSSQSVPFPFQVDPSQQSVPFPQMPPQVQNPVSPERGVINQVAQNVVQPDPGMPKPPLWRHILGGVAGATGVGRDFAPLITYGPGGLEQMRQHQEWERNLPRQVQMADAMEAADERRTANQNTVDQKTYALQVKQAQDAAAQATKEAEESRKAAADRQKAYEELSKFTSQGGTLWNPGDPVKDEDAWIQAPSGPNDPEGSKRYMPKWTAVSDDMAKSQAGIRLGLQPGQQVTKPILSAYASLSREDMAHPVSKQTVATLNGLVDTVIPPAQFNQLNQSWKARIVNAHANGATDKELDGMLDKAGEDFRAEKDRQQRAAEVVGNKTQKGIINPTTGESKPWKPGDTIPPGFMLEGTAGTVMGAAAKAEATDVKNAAEADRNFGAAQAYAKLGTGPGDAGLIQQFMGLTKPDNMGKMRFSGQEQNFIMNKTRSIGGDMQALWQKATDTGSPVLSNEQRQQMIDAMKVAVQYAKGHAKEGSTPSATTKTKNVWNPSKGAFEQVAQ